MKKLLFIVAVIAVTASYSYAGLVQTFGIGANASAQSEAVVAHANDPFAVYYNPAGLILTQKKTLSVGTTVFDASVKVRNFSITSTAVPGTDFNAGRPSNFESTGDIVFNPSLGFAMPITDDLGFGIAAYGPYGMDIEWDSDFNKNPGALYAWHSKYVREVITPGLGYRLSDTLAVGFSVSLGRSVSEAGATTTGKIVLEAEDSFNYSYNVGLMYRPVEALSLGLTYRSRTDAYFEGDAYVNGVRMSFVTMDYDHPECIQAGARYFINKRLSVEGDILWTRWSILEEQVEKTGTIIDDSGEIYMKRDWTDEYQYKIGVEWQALNNLVLRSGYTYDPTPVPDATFDMGWPDADRHVFNLGCGWTINEHWAIDAVVQHVRSMDARRIDGTSDSMNAAYGQLVTVATSGAVPADTVFVSMDGKGILWGYGLNVIYTF